MSAQGTRFECSICSAKVVVMVAGGDEVSCVHPAEPAAGHPVSSPPERRGSQLGKRYRCPACSQLVLCLAPGSGALTCHRQPMEVVPPQQLPSGD
jgi:DNA-directed RNA polymerase subunit RPC12/RpoP